MVAIGYSALSLGESDFKSGSNRTSGPTLGLRRSPSDSGSRRPQKLGRVSRSRRLRQPVSGRGRVSSHLRTEERWVNITR